MNKDNKESENCWDFMNCPDEDREKCPAYVSKIGKKCWMLVRGGKKICSHGENLEMKDCSECPWFIQNSKPQNNSGSRKIIKLLIVEDSSVKSLMLSNIFNNDPEIEVIKAVSSGEEALEKLIYIKPDIITMDINLPGMDGFETSEKILDSYPIPIVIISSLRNELNKDQLLEKTKQSGSLYFLDTPPSPWSPNYKNEADKIVRMIKLMSATKIVTRHKKRNNIYNRTDTDNSGIQNNLPENFQADSTKLIAIGVSTGGPAILSRILSRLPQNFPIPILVVQHIGIDFDLTLAQFLDTDCNLNVKIPDNNETAIPGYIYLAPAEKNLTINKDFKLILSDTPSVPKLKPSVSVLFKSVAENFGRSAVGILLTGMGKDGAEELKLIRDTGALTIVQNKESCVVFGMPAEAIKLNAAMMILDPEEIANTLLSIGEEFKNNSYLNYIKK